MYVSALFVYACAVGFGVLTFITRGRDGVVKVISVGAFVLMVALVNVGLFLLISAEPNALEKQLEERYGMSIDAPAVTSYPRDWRLDGDVHRCMLVKSTGSEFEHDLMCAPQVPFEPVEQVLMH